MLCLDLHEHTLSGTRLLVEALQLITEAAKKEPLPAGWKYLQRYLTPEERTHQRKDLVQRMLEIFKDLPNDKEFEAAARAGQAKKGWYARSAKTLQEVFGPDTPRFTALLASTSPQVSVQENLRNAVRIWEAWIKNGRPNDPKEIDKIGASVLGFRWTGGHTMTPEGNLKKTPGMQWNNNVISALTHPHPEHITLSSGGRAGKVDSFRANLLGDLSRVTNDAWMASFGGIEQQLFSSTVGYSAFSAKVRRVAEKMGWQPAEVQETIWSFFKALTEKGSKAKGYGKDILKTMTHGDVNDTNDFYDLMINDNEVKDAIERLRAGGHAGTASAQLRDGSEDPGSSPYSSAEKAGLAGSLERVADRAEEYRRIEELQNNATAGYSFPKASDVRITTTKVTFTLTDPRDIKEYQEKQRTNTILILPSKKEGYVELFRGAKQPGQEQDKNHTQNESGHLTMTFYYQSREQVKLSKNPNRQIDWEQWRLVNRKKQDKKLNQQLKMKAAAELEKPTYGGVLNLNQGQEG